MQRPWSDLGGDFELPRSRTFAFLSSTCGSRGVFCRGLRSSPLLLYIAFVAFSPHCRYREAMTLRIIPIVNDPNMPSSLKRTQTNTLGHRDRDQTANPEKRSEQRTLLDSNTCAYLSLQQTRCHAHSDLSLLSECLQNS